MRRLRWLCLAGFLLACAHASLLVGAIHRFSAEGAGYETLLEQTRAPLVVYPAGAYGFLGRAAWDSGRLQWLLDSIYRPAVQKAGGRSGAQALPAVADVGLWNAVTLLSLAATLLLFLIPVKKKRPPRRYL